MLPKLFSLRALELAIVISGLLLATGCPPERAVVTSTTASPDGTYLAAPNKLFDKDVKFDIRWNVTHEAAKDTFDPSTNVSNRALAISRCTNCHECAFSNVFDMQHYETPQWHPRYVGKQWAAPVRRMIAKENSFLNESIADRIYGFLRDETLGTYDESQDPRGGMIIDLDKQKKEKDQKPSGGSSGSGGAVTGHGTKS